MGRTYRVPNPVMTVIEQLKSDKLRLTVELNDSNDQTARAITPKDLANEEMSRLTLLIGAEEVEKQNLQQGVHHLAGIVKSLRHTTAKSVNESLN